MNSCAPCIQIPLVFVLVHLHLCRSRDATVTWLAAGLWRHYTPLQCCTACPWRESLSVLKIGTLSCVAVAIFVLTEIATFSHDPDVRIVCQTDRSIACKVQHCYNFKLKEDASLLPVTWVTFMSVFALKAQRAATLFWICFEALWRVAEVWQKWGRIFPRSLTSLWSVAQPVKHCASADQTGDVTATVWRKSVWCFGKSVHANGRVQNTAHLGAGNRVTSLSNSGATLSDVRLS